MSQKAEHKPAEQGNWNALQKNCGILKNCNTAAINRARDTIWQNIVDRLNSQMIGLPNLHN